MTETKIDAIMKTVRARLDGFKNWATGLGTSKDKSTFSTFGLSPRLTHIELTWLYEQSSMHAGVVDRIVDDATRTGFFSLSGEDKSFDFTELSSQLEDLGAINSLTDAAKAGRLYGGALVVMNIEDGLPSEEPLRLEDAAKLSSLTVIPSPLVVPILDSITAGIKSRSFADPEIYDLTGFNFGNAEAIRRVHRTRVIRFDGVRLPTAMRFFHSVSADGWGPSVLERSKTELSQLGDAEAYARNIMHEISVPMYKLEGLRMQLCSGEEGEEEIRAAMEVVKQNVDNLHVRVLDKEDEYVESTRTVSGMDLLLGRFEKAAIRSSGQPRTIFTGEQVTGLNANGQTEMDIWNMDVSSWQDKQMTPALNRLITILLAIRRRKDKSIPEKFTITYTPLDMPGEKEKAETNETQAKADKINIEMDVVAADEVRARLVSEGNLVELEGALDSGET